MSSPTVKFLSIIRRHVKAIWVAFDEWVGELTTQK